jgi:hypothetical protein
MAKIGNPGHIDSSSGKIGKSVMYERRGKQCMRSYVIPSNPDSPGQRVCRSAMKTAVKRWQDLPMEDKKLYNKRADRSKKSLTGYNLFISEFLKRNRKWDK